MKHAILVASSFVILALSTNQAWSQTLKNEALNDFLPGKTFEFSDGSRSFFLENGTTQFAYPPSKYFIKDNKICIEGRYQKWGCDQIIKKGDKYVWKNGKGKRLKVKVVDQ